MLMAGAIETGAGEVDLAEIWVPPDRLRQLRPDAVADLARSMSEAGLISPIVVAEDGRLIVGWHRYEAAKRAWLVDHPGDHL
jgi:ParB-like chromosome segregation protein Spo0J